MGPRQCARTRVHADPRAVNAVRRCSCVRSCRQPRGSGFDRLSIRRETVHAVEEKRTRWPGVALEERHETPLVQSPLDHAHRVPRSRGTDQLELAVVLIRPEEWNGRIRLPRSGRGKERRGANPDRQANDGYTALHKAAASGCGEIVKLLLLQG